MKEIGNIDWHNRGLGDGQESWEKRVFDPVGYHLCGAAHNGASAVFHPREPAVVTAAGTAGGGREKSGEVETEGHRCGRGGCGYCCCY